MNINLLKRTELKQLATLIHRSSEQAETTNKAMNHVFKQIKNSSEDVQGFVWDKIPKQVMQQIKLPHQTVK